MIQCFLSLSSAVSFNYSPCIWVSQYLLGKSLWPPRHSLYFSCTDSSQITPGQWWVLLSALEPIESMCLHWRNGIVVVPKALASLGHVKGVRVRVSRVQHLLSALRVPNLCPIRGSQMHLSLCSIFSASQVPTEDRRPRMTKCSWVLVLALPGSLWPENICPAPELLCEWGQASHVQGQAQNGPAKEVRKGQFSRNY